ncbi:MAG: hypothetical protein AAF585_03180, partial [Verrucomicrobiota bacterium]
TEVAKPINVAAITEAPAPMPEASAESETQVVETEDSPPHPEPEPAAAEAETEEESKTVGAPRREPQETSEEIMVELVLKSKSKIENLNEVSYNNEFGLYEYEVKKVSKGEYPYDTVRVAHMLVLHKKFTGANRFEEGKTYYLTLVKRSKYPRLEQVQLFDDLPMDLDLPIYICKF